MATTGTLNCSNVLHINSVTFADRQPHCNISCAQRNSRTYLHPVGGEPQLLPVAPQHLGPGPDGRAGQQLVEVGHLILAVVADQDEHGALAGHDGPLDQRPDAGVELLADHFWGPLLCFSLALAGFLI